MSSVRSSCLRSKRFHHDHASGEEDRQRVREAIEGTNPRIMLHPVPKHRDSVIVAKRRKQEGSDADR
jgi:hypothetical protein